jgi:DnaK suppressor protein
MLVTSDVVSVAAEEAFQWMGERAAHRCHERTSRLAGSGAGVSAGAGKGERMDEDEARARLRAERAEVQRLLEATEAAGQADRAAEDERGVDIDDAAQPLTEQLEDDAIAASLRDRLAALDRAERRLGDGTYGRSVRSGLPIPDERLEADPAAELTVEEARAQR